ncbi:MAG: hypothetical protein CBD16_02620 [Betaproteobacteria bacterium TMED156]|nr:MAG: hypothetical protein CBD16_02620 [Betaproteobacteria bacterium TMED156]|tara:strand:+ start:335 stop:898 length:564 start_codon:yes stop_codon:yes gene_type:complete
MLKPLIWILAALPSLDLLILVFYQKLGANPQEAILRELGTWTLVFLLLVYSIPLLSKFGLSSLQKCRRMLGLWAFFYVVLHFVAFLLFENELVLQLFIEDLFRRPFVTFGFSAFILLIPMAITSNKKCMTFLGNNWKKIHKLITPVLIFSIIHYFLHRVGKNDFFEPIIALAIFTSIFVLKKSILKN